MTYLSNVIALCSNKWKVSVVYKKYVKELFETMINARLGTSHRVHKLLKGWFPLRFTRDQIYLLPETTKNTGQAIWNNSFQSTEHWEMKDSDPSEMGKKLKWAWQLPLLIPKRVSRLWCRAWKFRQSLADWVSDTKADRVSGQSTTDESYTQRKSQRSVESVTGNCMWRNYSRLEWKPSEKSSKQCAVRI